MTSSREDGLVEVNNSCNLFEMQMAKISTEMSVSQSFWTNLLMDSQDFGGGISCILLHQRVILNFDCFWQKQVDNCSIFSWEEKLILKFASGDESGPNGIVHRKLEDLIYNKVNGQDDLFEVMQ